MMQQLEIGTNSQEMECPQQVEVTFVGVEGEKCMRKDKEISSILSKTQR